MTPPPPRAPQPDTTCAVCVGPLISVRDDPHDPGGTTHPGCAPVDPARWDRHDRRVEETRRREAGRDWKVRQR